MGSSVDMSCTYTYPQDLTVERDFWTIVDSSDPPDISQDPIYSQRVKVDCVDEPEGNCTLKIKRVTRGDAKKYYCRITTQTSGQKWLGKSGATLSVTGTKIVCCNIMLLILQKETNILVPYHRQTCYYYYS